MPDKISASASGMSHHTYRFNEPAGKGDSSYTQRLSSELVNSPTPMTNQPATSQGNRIDVNADNAISRLTGQDNVMSYKIAMPNGTNGVLNVTTGDHAAKWGIVLRAVQGSAAGAQSITTYGEGDSLLQRAFDPNNNQSREVWRNSSKRIIENANESK